MKITAKAKDCTLAVKVKTTGREKVDEKELGRFTRAYLRCFLKPKQVKRNVVEFTGPIGVPLKERLKKEITKRDFLFVVEYIAVAIQKLSANNFPICNLNMDLQYIFINETTKELQFLYMPLTDVQKSVETIELLNSIIYLAQPAAEQDTDYISRFNYFVKATNPFDIDQIEQFVQHEDRSVVNTVRKHNAGQSGFMTSDHKRYYDHMEAQKKMQEDGPVHQPISRGDSKRSAADEDATSLLTETRVKDNCFSGFGETASPATGFVQTTGVSGYGNTDNFAGSDEATGLLTNFAETAGHITSRREPIDYFAGFGVTASPETGFVQNNDFVHNTGFGRDAAGHFADPEEATGLLVENPGMPRDFVRAESVVSYDEEATSLLVDTRDGGWSAPSPQTPTVVYPELCRIQTGETIQVNKPVFRVGKERSYVDYFVANNSAVSRSHADIITRGSSYFITDLNSKNKTYVNDQAIPPQTETAIRDGDKIRLANEEFTFRVIGGVQSAVNTGRCPNCNTPITSKSNFCFKCGQRIRS